MMPIITVEIPEDLEMEIQEICNGLDIPENKFVVYVLSNFFDLTNTLQDASNLKVAEKAAEEYKKHPERVVSHEEVRKKVLKDAD